MSHQHQEWHSTVNANFMKGLFEFIKEIRVAQSKEAEEKRVQIELAKIRKSFRNEKMKDYDRRKYTAKLVYIHMLGYEIDFGYMEAIKLMSLKTSKYQDKHMGYVALGILLHESHEMIPLMVQQMQKDLGSDQDAVICLALNAIANLGGQEMAEALSPAVQKLISLKSSSILVKKKACLALLRLFRKFPDLLSSETWSTKMEGLMNESNIGLLTAASSLLLALAKKEKEPYEGIAKRAVVLFSKLLKDEAQPEYHYYGVSAPFLQVKLLKFLQLYEPPKDSKSRISLIEALSHVLSRADTSKTPTFNHKNAANCILFESINLITAIDDDSLTRKAIGLLGKFITFKEFNVRYLSLEALTLLINNTPQHVDMVKKHQETVLKALDDPDISIRKRALNLMYSMCDRENAEEIVSALIKYLTAADYKIREELVLKIAILAEKFATDYSWYVDAILKLIALAGDFVTEDVWYRVIHLVSNHEDIQSYACKVVLKALQRPNCHETAIKVGAYILGEWGHLIADFPDSSPMQQYQACHGKFFETTLPTRALLLSTYAKFVNLYPELTDVIRKVFYTHMSSIDSEIQQRALEYYLLTDPQREALLQVVWDIIPAFPQRSIDRMDTANSSSSSSSSNNKPRSDNHLLRTDLSDPAPNPQKRSDPSKTPQKQAPITKNEKAFDPIEELLGMVSSNSTATATNISTYNADPLSLLGMGPSQASASPMHSASAQSDSSAHPNPDVSTSSLIDNGRLKKVAIGPEGILFQDQIIQVGFKSDFSGNTGRVMIYYGNVTDSAITNFSAHVAQQPHLQITAQPPDPTIQKKTQMQQLITMQCLTGFDKLDQLPAVRISFTHNGQNHTATYILPAVVTRFMEPLKFSTPDFFKKWGDLKESQEVIKSSLKIDIPTVTKLVQGGLHFQVLQGVDNNPNNLVAAGQFNSVEEPQIVLLRVETNPATPNLARATCRASNAIIAAGVVNLMKLELN